MLSSRANILSLSIARGLLLAGTTTCVFLSFFAWIMRDGLGPEAVDSDGFEALSRWFWCFYSGPALLLCITANVLWGKYLAKPLARNTPESGDLK